jgi:6-phosphogluconolactonase
MLSCLLLVAYEELLSTHNDQSSTNFSPTIKTFLFSLFLCLLTSFVHAQSLDVYFGTGGGAARGIYHATLDVARGKLSPATLAAVVDAPGFLAYHPDGRHLYAVARSEAGHVVCAYTIAEDGALTLLNAEPIPDGEAAHLSVHPSGRFLLTAQYSGGSVALFPLDLSGRVQACQQVIEHQGASRVHPNQASPHPHWVGYAPDGRFAFVTDLGLDQIVVYRIQPDYQSLRAIAHIDAPPGAGPRHMKFSVDGAYIFLLNEFSLSVSRYRYDAATGQADFLDSVSTLSEEAKSKEARNSASEIVVHPSGSFVYAANRGHDSVTAFHIDSDTGQLALIDIEPIRGAWPRSIALDPSGRWLLAAGADSNSVTVLAIDPNSGELQYPRHRIINVPNVICVLMPNSVAR